MTRLLLITTSYPEHNEGAAAAGTFVKDFAEELVRQGVAVEVVAPGLSPGWTVETGVEVRRFAVPRLPLSLLNLATPRDWFAIALTWTHGKRAVMSACEENLPNHILALWALPSGDWARRAARRCGLTYSVWALGSDIWSLGRIPVIRGILEGVLRTAQHRFADGYGLAEQVEAIAGCKCEFLPSSRNLPIKGGKLIRQQGPYRLTFLGRWHPNKGIDLLLDALGMLDEQTWVSIESLRIFGGGPLEIRIRQQAAKLVAAGKPIAVGGYLGKVEAAALLEGSDYLLLPSRIESIPVIFSDAMQARCPIVAMPVGDLPRLLSRYEVGELAEKITAQAFASAIKRILLRKPVEFSTGLEQAAHDFRLERTVSNFIKSIAGFTS